MAKGSNGECSVRGCSRAARTRGWCVSHWRRWRKTGDVEADVPLRENCAKGEFRECKIEGCHRQLYNRGWCSLHYDRWRTKGDVGPVGRIHTGNGHITDRGYRRIPVGGGDERFEHHVKMEMLIGRVLRPNETVHHVNGDRADNSTDGPLVDFRGGNLELWASGHPRGQRVRDKVTWALEILAQYAPEKLA